MRAALTVEAITLATGALGERAERRLCTGLIVPAEPAPAEPPNQPVCGSLAQPAPRRPAPPPQLTGGGKEGFTLGRRRDFVHDQVVHTTITQEGSHVLSQTMSSDGTDPDAVLAAPAPSPAAWPRLGGLWHDPGPERLPHGRRSRLAGP